ncbi:MAG: Fpg/Nei family DNA glycosylase [Tepidisphaeraceae bacterium]
MPELPEVETVVRMLRRRLLGAELGHVELLRPDIITRSHAPFAASIHGRTVSAIERRAKRILIRLDNGATLGVHLGMTGQLTVVSANAPRQPHTHLIIEVQTGPASPLTRNPVAHASSRRSNTSTSPAESGAHPGSLLHFVPPCLRASIPSASPPPACQLRFRDVRRFGEVWLDPDASRDEAGLGPEPLDLPTTQLAAILRRTTRAIKTALLDQKLLAGLGNIYADEALFLARIHPRTPANRLTAAEVKRLNPAIKRVLREAIANHGSTLRDYIDPNGDTGWYQTRHRVYAREHEPCCKCKTPIHRIVLGGRSTHFCPVCQPATRRSNKLA